MSNHTTPAGTIHTLDFSSQVWQGITWNHELTIYEPTDLTYQQTVLLFITGGGTGGKSDDDDHKQAFALTRVTGSRVALLHQVPNQPLLGEKTEDALIAETFVRYLETKDKNWPLLFPMVKSAVRAMDAGQAWDRERGDTLRGLKPCSFSELLPSNMPGVPRTTWRKPGYLRGLGPLPTALGTLQPATRWGGADAYGDVCDSSNSSIMVGVLRGDLLPTTANIDLPKSQFHRTRGWLSFKDRSQRSSLV